MERKLAKYRFCLRQARELTQNYLETGDKRYLAIRKETMSDARYWKQELASV